MQHALICFAFCFTSIYVMKVMLLTKWNDCPKDNKIIPLTNQRDHCQQVFKKGPNLLAACFGSVFSQMILRLRDEVLWQQSIIVWFWFFYSFVEVTFAMATIVIVPLPIVIISCKGCSLMIKLPYVFQNQFFQNIISENIS